MSNYTVELRKIPESLIDEALAHYPLFMDGYRATLNRKIKEHFWYNEIAHETIDQFLFQLRIKMNEIMPYYNQLYESELTKRDPFITQRIKSTSSMDSKSSATTSERQSSKSGNTSKAKSRAVNSDTPQVPLSGRGDYATSAADSVSDTTADSTGSGESSGAQSGTAATTSTSESSGFSGSMAHLIQAHRDAIINVDMMIIAQIEPLFMLIWNPPIDMIGDDFYARWW